MIVKKFLSAWKPIDIEDKIDVIRMGMERMRFSNQFEVEFNVRALNDEEIEEYIKLHTQLGVCKIGDEEVIAKTMAEFLRNDNKVFIGEFTQNGDKQ